MQVTLQDWTLEIDETATKNWYASAEDWDCDCGDCRNFLNQASAALPEQVQTLFSTLGIPAEKASYVCELEEQEDGNFLYQVQYPLAGTVQSRGAEHREFRVLEPGQRIEPDGAPEFPQPRLDLELYLSLPWTLREPKDGPHQILVSSDLEEDTADIAVLLQKVIPAALDAEGVKTPCEVDVLLTDDDGIHQINLDMRQVDRPTDVLSFPMFNYVPGEPPVDDLDADPETGCTPLGDMVLSLERARAQAQEYGHSVERELSYLAVHSILHLLGYDHMDEGPQKAQMRGREETILNALGITRA